MRFFDSQQLGYREDHVLACVLGEKMKVDGYFYREIGLAGWKNIDFIETISYPLENNVHAKENIASTGKKIDLAEKILIFLMGIEHPGQCGRILLHANESHCLEDMATF